MKELNLYILEKLKINKDSVKVFAADKYKENDKCLLIWFFKDETVKGYFLCLKLIKIVNVIADNNFKISFNILELDGEAEATIRRWENINKNRKYAIIDDSPLFGSSYRYYRGKGSSNIQEWEKRNE